MAAIVQKQRCVGVLHTDSRVKYGVEKGKTLYLFEPYDRSMGNLHVPSKLMHQTKKKYVYVEWDGPGSERGTLLDYLGDVGDPEAEYLYLKYICGLQHIKPLKVGIFDHRPCETDLPDAEYQVYSIDPLGCRDIDDAFHYDEIRHQIGIHIAYPWYFFQRENANANANANAFESLSLFLQRVSTLYLPGEGKKNIPMMHREIAEGEASLLEKTTRRAITILYQLDDTEERIVGTEIKVGTIVYVVKNYDYETVDQIFQKNRDTHTHPLSKKESYLQNWRTVSQRIFPKNACWSHCIVEDWMILTNQTVATYLVNRYGSRVLLRTMQDGQDLVIEEGLKQKMDTDLQSFLKMIQSEGAEYQLYDSDRELSMRHSQMGEESYYTHFTSPIRRFCDLYNQALLSETVPDGFVLGTNEIDSINRITRSMRKYQRMCAWTDFIFQYSSGLGQITTNAIIYEINPEKKILRFYLTDEPYKGLVLKKSVVKRRFEEITHVIWNEEEKVLRVREEGEGEERRYQLYERRRIQIYLYPNRHHLQDRVEILFCD